MQTAPLNNISKACGAKTRNGDPCRNPAQSGGKCRMHSGNARIGVASPRFKHGRYSTSLPARMQEKYHEYLRDPLLVESKRNIALMDARIDDLLEQVDHGESGELWEALSDAWNEIGPAIYRERSGHGEPADRTRDTDNAVESLGLIISQGGSNFKVWQEIRETTEQRRKCADSQTKRDFAAATSISAERVAVLFGVISELLKTYVRNPVDLAAAARRLNDLAIESRQES